MKNVKNLVSCDSNAIEDMEKHVLKHLITTYLKIKEDIETLDKAIELVGARRAGSLLKKREEENAKLQFIANLLPCAPADCIASRLDNFDKFIKNEWLRH